MSKEPAEKGFYSLAVPVLDCSHCRKWMVSGKLVEAAFDIDPWFEGFMIAQVTTKKCVIMSSALKNGKRLCQPCLEYNAVGVRCYACSKEVPGSFFVRIFGNFEIGLCCTCYETMPAKQWEEKVAWLSKCHATLPKAE